MSCACSLLVSVALVATAVSGEKVIEDLSHVQKSGLVAYPIYPDLNFTIGHRGIAEGLGGIWLEYNYFATVEHYGTHVDVPAHMMKSKWRLHQVPVQNFMGPAVVIDLTERAKQDPDTQVRIADLQAWEDKYGRIPDGAMVLLRSGWDKKFSDAKAFFGTNTPDDTRSFHFPGFHPDSVKWLVENRPKFNGIGSDAISFDYGPSTKFGAHLNLLAANKVGYENLANLEKIPVAGAMFYAAPMNLYDGSGCPVRAFGIYDSESSSSARPALTFYILFSVLLTCALTVLS